MPSPNESKITEINLPGDESKKGASLRIWKEDDSRSLIRLVPDSIREAMFTVPEDMREMEERTLKKIVAPTAVDNQIRYQFWLEYERVQSRALPRMELVMIYTGVHAEENFYRLLKSPNRVAWMLCPPTHYMSKMREALDFGMSKLRDLMDEIPMTDKNGKFIKANADLLLRVTAFLDMRINGGIKQHLQIDSRHKSMNMSIGLDYKKDGALIGGMVESMNMDEINKRLAYLEKKELMIEKSQHPASLPKNDIEVKAQSVLEASQAIDSDSDDGDT